MMEGTLSIRTNSAREILHIGGAAKGTTQALGFVHVENGGSTPLYLAVVLLESFRPSICLPCVN